MLPLARGLHVEPLTPSGFGAVVDVGECDIRALDEDTWRSLHAAFLTHGGLLLIRGQEHCADDPAAVKAFARRFGSLETNDKYVRMRMQHQLLSEDHPEILQVGNALGTRSMMIKVDPARPLLWHCDDSFRQPQPMGSCFFCVHAPSEGARTHFASGTAAWQALEPARQAALRNLVAVHNYDALNERLREEARKRGSSTTLHAWLRLC